MAGVLLATAARRARRAVAPAAQAADVGTHLASTRRAPSALLGPGPPLAEAPAHLRLEAVTGIANVQPRVQTAVNGAPAGALDGDVRRRDATVDGAPARSEVDAGPRGRHHRRHATASVVKVDLQEDLHSKARLTEKEARGYAERRTKVQRLGAALPRRRPARLVLAEVRERHLDAVLVRERQGGRARPHLATRRHEILSSWTGPAGGVVDGPRPQVVVRQAHQRPAHLHPADGAVRGRPVRLAAAAVACATSTCWRSRGSARPLYFFNAGLIFWSVPLAYPPLLYLFGRLLWLGFGKGARPGYTTRWPIWLVAGLAVFALGFRAGLNVWGSNVIDVGYASVVGADRLLDGRSPYGNMPQSTGKPCGTKYSDGSYAAYVQTDGACESAGRPRRHLRPGHLLLVRADDGGARLERALGRPASGARDLDPVRLPGRRGAGAGGLAARRQAPGGRRAVPVGDVPVHGLRDVLEHERRDTRGVPGLGPRPVHDAAPARVHARPRDGGEVLADPAAAALDPRRPAAARRSRWSGRTRRAARRCVPRPGAARARLGPAAARADRAQGRVRLRARDRALVRAADDHRRPVRRARQLLGPHVRLAARPPVAVLDLGLGRVPGLPRPRGASRRR